MNIRLFPLYLFLYICVSLQAQKGVEIEWQRALGGSLQERSEAISFTPDGGVVVAGHSLSSDGLVAGNYGQNDVWVVKLDSASNIEWQNHFGGSGQDQAYSATALPNGEIVVVGLTYSTDFDVSTNQGAGDMWVFKLDMNGNLIWEKTYGGSNFDGAFSVETYPNGDILVAGFTNSNDGDVSGNNGLGDVWVVKLDPQGNLLWQNPLGGSNGDSGYDAVLTSDGGIAVVGITLSNDGDVSGHHGDWDFWVIKLDSAGNLLWQNALGGSGEDQPRAITESSDGGIVVAGLTRSMDGDVSNFLGGFGDSWIVKLNSSGVLQWEKSIGGTSSENIYALEAVSDNQVIALGYSRSNNIDLSGSHGSDDLWLCKLDGASNMVWSELKGGWFGDLGLAMDIDGNGDIVTTGISSSRDGDVGKNYGITDYWVLKLSDEFVHIEGEVFADLNSDGLVNAGDLPIPYRPISNLINGLNYTTTGEGYYSVPVVDTGFTTIAPRTIPHYTANPANYTGYYDTLYQQVDSANRFAFQPVGPVNDLAVTLTPLTPFRPGFQVRYAIDYRNVGTTVLVPEVVIEPNSSLSFNSSTIAPSSFAPDSIAWQLPPLSPFQAGQITATFTLSATVPIGTYVLSTAHVFPKLGDARPVDNRSSIRTLVTGSYDPNDILVDEELIQFPDLSPTPPDLTYIIRFQNTGTDTAFTVRVENDVPENVDLSTFQFEASSHATQVSYLPHVDRLEFLFENILLPDSNVNEPLSNGYIRYRITPKASLMIGDSILNDARIYFDFNAPIQTNVAWTVIENTVGFDDNDFESHWVKLSPNPTSDYLSVTLPRWDQGQIRLFDASGRMVLDQAFNSASFQVDIHTLARGTYQLKVLGQLDEYTESLIKW